MMERWREPAKIEAVEQGDVLSTDLGRPALEPSVTVSRETFERMRLGYVCVQCYEPHEHPFPERCAVCRFEMRKLQLERLARDFGGELWLGPQETLDDEASRIAEQRQSKIVLPPGVRAS